MADEETSAVAEEAPAEESAGPAIDPEVAGLIARLEQALGDAVVASGDAFGTAVVRVKPDSWRRAAEVAKLDLGCDYLSFVSGIDWMPAPKEGEEGSGDTSSPVQPVEQTYGVTGSAGRFQAFAHVESTAHKYGVVFKTDVDETNPIVESWVPVYVGADWHERECWEMFGFVFDGHPSLRHLYLPGGFEGHPLRKDFPLLARVVKPWPGLVDVEGMPGDDDSDAAAEATAEGGSE